MTLTRFPRRTWLFFLAALFCRAVSALAQPATHARLHDTARDHMEYLDNGIIRVGADLDLGGAITLLSDARNGINVINSFDWGRQVQLSFYSGPVPYAPGGRQPKAEWAGLGWNPIQVGDAYGHRSKILESRNDGKTIYTRCVPMHWPLDNVPGECTFETWITLDGNAVRVKARLNNNRADDKTQYPARMQELPAVYSNGPLYRLVTYSGEKPFTSDTLTVIPTENGQAWPWRHWQATEHWSALVQQNDWGLGVYCPGASEDSGGFAGKTGQGGPKDNPTGYIAPNNLEILDWNIQYDFDFVLILGYLKDIRQWVAQHAARPAPPRYIFEKDRQHWFYRNAGDTGWPIRGQLDVDLSRRGAVLLGPAEFWQAVQAPQLTLQAAFTSAPGKARVIWEHFDSGDPGALKPVRPRSHKRGSVDFEIIPDGRFHTYVVDLAASPDYRGAIGRIGLEFPCAGKPGNTVKIKMISLRKD